MFFFFRRPTVEVVALTEERYNFAKEYTPVALAREKLPSWWKNLTPGRFNWESMHGEANVKSCVGIIQQLTTGIIAPMWSDLAIKAQGDDYEWQYSDRTSRIDIHKNENAPGFYSNSIILKLVTPWVFKTDISFQVLDPFYHFTEPRPFIIPPGIILPQKGYIKNNTFIFIQRSIDKQQIFIKRGTPLTQFVPLTEKKIKLKNEVITDSEFRKISSVLGASASFNARGVKNISIERAQERTK